MGANSMVTRLLMRKDDMLEYVCEREREQCTIKVNREAGGRGRGGAETDRQTERLEKHRNGISSFFTYLTGPDVGSNSKV